VLTNKTAVLQRKGFFFPSTKFFIKLLLNLVAVYTNKPIKCDEI